MALPSGSKLGPYEITSMVGAGGMGEVYRARDTRLDRTVAIKVLPAHLSSNPDLKQRFEREARAISALSHPYICALHDIGHQDGIDYLVMEFVEGETLDKRLSKGALTTGLVTRYGIQIADALDKAHKQGIVHRDLKPGNIMITKSGVKLLDFGLAKLSAQQTPVALSSVSALMTEQPKNLTAEGTILGTLQYMSPEQLEAKETDARTDIFALGTVLYEMATGKKAFTGKSQASLIAAILEKDPEPISTVQPMTPPALDHVVKKCLAKDPDDRWQTAHDVGSELKWISESGSQAGVPAPVISQRKIREYIAWSIAAISLIIAVFLAIVLPRFVRQPVIESRVQRISLVHGIGSGPSDLAISPDGRSVVYSAPGQSGIPVLWVRNIDSFEPRPLAGTEGGSQPFWSPDSHSIAFFADGFLKRMEASGGPVKIIAKSYDVMGGSWSPNGTILFSPNTGAPLLKVPVEGGKVETATKLPDPAWGHTLPSFLPDGRHFLFVARDWSHPIETSLGGIYMGSLDSMDEKRLLPDHSRAIYSPPGYIIFERDGELMAVPFDVATGRVTGDALPLKDKVDENAWFLSSFSVSNDGIIATHFTQSTETGTQLRWLDRSGKLASSLSKTGENLSFGTFDLSPDGRRLAVQIRDLQTLNNDIWMVDVQTGSKTRVTSSPQWDGRPIWSPDGSRIAYATQPSGMDDVYIRDLRSGQTTPLIVSLNRLEHPVSWSRDGKYLLVYTVSGADTADPKYDIYFWSFAENKLKPYATSPGNKLEVAQFSPDTRYVALASNETGRFEAYVASFPNPTQKWQLTTDGIFNVVSWSADGREILVVNRAGDVEAIPVNSSHGFESGTPTIVAHVGNDVPFLVATPDHSKLLAMMKAAPSSTVADIRLLIGWPALLKH